MQHSGRVKIDEEGCEAAAFTVIMLEKAMYAQQDKAEFILDRPFLFAVKGSSTVLNSAVPFFRQSALKAVESTRSICFSS